MFACRSHNWRCVEETRIDLEENGLISTLIGHVGDGNFHCLPICMPDDQEAQDKITAFTKRLSERALKLAAPVQVSMVLGRASRVTCEQNWARR